MMKKLSILCSLIVASIFCMPLSAEVISTEYAQETANTFMTLDNEWHGVTDATIRLVEHNDTPAYYVIEYAAGGWAIVSAQTSSSPIIGYSTEGKFAAPGAMELLLDFNAKVITARALDNGNDEHKGWRRIKERKAVREMNMTPDVAPLIKINLDQSAPFNSYCPEIDGEKTLVGCVAVGMAQAIMVQRYPKAPNGEYTYHCNQVGTLRIDYDNERPYDWDSMYNGNTDEIARLLYHCGVSVEMMYDIYGSGAVTEDVASALSRNFGYDADKVRFVTKTHDVEAWLETILGELVEGRAVVYRGQSGSAGHCWNVDGWKQATQMVHCNWGWDGFGNGYFDINNMTDSYQGMNFLYGHSAVIGVGAPLTAPYDILLSKNHFVAGTEPGYALADVSVLCGDNEAVYSYELYCEKNGDNYTSSPYQIVDGKLVSTQVIANESAFKHLYIRVTNTNNGKWYEKEFKIYITSQDASDIAGVYTASAMDGVDNYTYKEWAVNITVDENDKNKVWFQPLCHFLGLEDQHISPVYAVYDAHKSELSMPLGQKMFKRSGYNMVNALSYDGVSMVTSGELVMQISFSDKVKKITLDPSYILGVVDVNNNYKVNRYFEKVCFKQDNSTFSDIQLSTTQFYSDIQVGTPLADIIVTNKNPEAVINYQLFGPKDENFNYTTSPYKIIDGKLVSTEPIVDSNRFRYVLIKATDTVSGESIDKGFYITIISLRSYMLAGQYYAYAKSSFTDFPDEEWQITIAVDDADDNKLLIQPICRINNLAPEEINSVYGILDASSYTISMPLGQILYEEEDIYRLVTGAAVEGIKPNTTGIVKMHIYKNEDNIEITFANNSTFGVGNDIDNGWWYQAINEIVFSNREIIAVDNIYYNITNDTNHTVEVTFRGVNCNQHADEYQGAIVIPSTIDFKDTSYKVTSIGSQAFYNCGELYAITIPGSVAHIGSEAFALCTGIGNIKVEATTPPTIEKNTFEQVDKSIPVEVPIGCVEAYKNAPYWCEFTNINESSGVNQIVTPTPVVVNATNGYVTIVGAKDEAEVNIYSLCGMLLHHTTVINAGKIVLPQGIYLVQIEGSTYKVVI